MGGAGSHVRPLMQLERRRKWPREGEGGSGGCEQLPSHQLRLALHGLFICDVRLRFALSLLSVWAPLSPPRHPAGQTLVASKPGLTTVPWGFYLPEINTDGEASSSRMILRGKSSPAQNSGCWAWCRSFCPGPSLSHRVPCGQDLPRGLAGVYL